MEKQPYELAALRDDGTVKDIEVLGKQAEPDAWALAQDYANLWRSVVELLHAPHVIASSAEWTSAVNLKFLSV